MAPVVKAYFHQDINRRKSIRPRKMILSWLTTLEYNFIGILNPLNL